MAKRDGSILSAGEASGPRVSALGTGRVSAHVIDRYRTAIFLALGTVVVVAVLQRVLPFPARILFVAPVAVASRYGGRGPAIAASVLGILAIRYGVDPASLPMTQDDSWVFAVLFAVIAYTIDSSSQALRRSRQEVEHRAAELQQVNASLEQQVEEVRALSEYLHEANTSLEAARDEAVAATHAREEVLAVVAHDLRNPLNLVTMTTQLLSEVEPSAERRQQLLDIMQRAAHRMNRLIDDLLEVARIDAGRMSLELTRVSASDILDHTFEMLQFHAADRGIALTVDGRCDGLWARADEARIVQALGNLVGNAIKFVQRGGSIRLHCTKDGEFLQFSVCDTGPGIAPAQMERLFDKFWQARRSDRRGVGLGLTIARGIIEAHGGKLWARSREGSGTTFYFTLPAMPD